MASNATTDLGSTVRGTRVLLVCDELLLIESVKLLLTRERCEVSIATSAADAVLMFGEHQPSLVLLGVAVEGGRGRVALEGMSQHPDWPRSSLILLGGTLPGVDAPTLALPLDVEAFIQLIRGSARDFTEPSISAVADRGPATPEQLARVLLGLADGPPAAIEFLCPEGMRTLWVHGGKLAGATSSIDGEALLDRALADGLIAGPQASSLISTAPSSPAELLRVLLDRSWIREVEAVPLLQRYVEDVALAALIAPASSYRVRSGEKPPDPYAAASPRSLFALFSEAMQGRVSVEVMLEQVGGLQAVPTRTERHSMETALSLDPVEQSLLREVDGVACVEELLRRVPAVQAQALNALWLGKLLGLLEFRSPQNLSTPPPLSSNLEVERLHSKLEEAREADYFSILSIPRSAGGAEVKRAFQLLSSQFAPLKFAGHPDPSVVDRARELGELMWEAAQALEDDRLRGEYARSLAD